MKLSEAIRLGAMLKPQAFGRFQEQLPFQWLRKWLSLPLGRTCALGAAYEAGNCRSVLVTATDRESTFRGSGVAAGEVTRRIQFPPDWLTVLHCNTNCPVGCERVEMVERIIPHLNDTHRWTREMIAGWVEMIEDNIEVVLSKQAEVVNEQEN